MRKLEQQDFDKVNEAIDNINYGDLESAKTIFEKVIINIHTNHIDKFIVLKRVF